MSQEHVGKSLVSHSPTCDSSAATSNFSSPPQDILKGGTRPTAKEVVQTLTSFVRIAKDEKDGISREFVVVKCPNGQYCKNTNAEIRYPNKSGYKNPYSHLRSCLAKVRQKI